MTASDALPLELCYQCASTIIAWDTLLRNCLEADKKLKQILEDSNKADELKMEEVEIDADDHPVNVAIIIIIKWVVYTLNQWFTGCSRYDPSYTSSQTRDQAVRNLTFTNFILIKVGSVRWCFLLQSGPTQCSLVSLTLRIRL